MSCWNPPTCGRLTVRATSIIGKYCANNPGPNLVKRFGFGMVRVWTLAVWRGSSRRIVWVGSISELDLRVARVPGVSVCTSENECKCLFLYGHGHVPFSKVAAGGLSRWISGWIGCSMTPKFRGTTLFAFNGPSQKAIVGSWTLQSTLEHIDMTLSLGLQVPSKKVFGVGLEGPNTF